MMIAVLQAQLLERVADYGAAIRARELHGPLDDRTDPGCTDARVARSMELCFSSVLLV